MGNNVGDFPSPENRLCESTKVHFEDLERSGMEQSDRSGDHRWIRDFLEGRAVFSRNEDCALDRLHNRASNSLCPMVVVSKEAQASGVCEQGWDMSRPNGEGYYGETSEGQEAKSPG